MKWIFRLFVLIACTVTFIPLLVLIVDATDGDEDALLRKMIQD